MKNILIKVVQINMAVMDQDYEDDNDVKGYDSTNCIICREQARVKADFCASCENNELMLIFLFGM